MAAPTTFGVSSKSFLNASRELVAGTPVTTTPGFTLPMDKGSYSPEDTPKFLPDEAIRGVMAMLYNDIIGVEDATFSFGGPVFMDDIGLWSDNAFGDMSTTISGGTLGTAEALTGATAVGATTLTVGTSIGTVTAGSLIYIVDAATGNEVVIATNTSGTSPTFTNTPLRFAHSTSATAALVTSQTGMNFSHKWAILNSGTGQPPTQALTDWTGLTSSVGARTYPSACVSQLDFTGNVEGLLMYKVSGNSWLSAPAGATPSPATSFVKPQAAWESTVSVGGSQVYSVTSWTASIKRTLKVYWTAGNSQTPYVIARGGLGATYGLNFGVPSDESPLSNMLTAGPQALVLTTSNGLSGSSLLSLTITSTTAQTVKSKPTRNDVLVGYDNSLEAVANTTDVGGSGGIGPATVTVVNNTPCY
jgi:hypothetical protein